jgi:surface antigen
MGGSNMSRVSDFMTAYSARRAVSPLSAIVAAVILTGCAISTPLGPIFGSAEDDTTTGSIPARDVRLSATMNQADWDQTKAALQAALAPTNLGQSILWTSLTASTHGSVTPVSDSFVENKIRCRSFVAALADPSGTQWYQGKACQKDASWTVVSAEPWALPRA